MNVADRVVDQLARCRQRTLDLLAPLDDRTLTTQHSPLMSPLVWDFAHVANYEELWLARTLTGQAACRPELDDVYDAFRHPRSTRAGLRLLGPAEARVYAAAIRARVLDVVTSLDLSPTGDDRLLADGYVHTMVAQHEHQHDETMLAALQLLPAPGYAALAGRGPAVPFALSRARATEPAEVLVDGGQFPMGTDSHARTLDNERPAHDVYVAPFFIDTFPVTNGRYQQFIADGGYGTPAWWTDAGWAWRTEAGLSCPQFWAGSSRGGWSVTRFGIEADVLDDEPVQHVCWYEADAFARWAGRRLPTEAEWEKAASWGPDGAKRLWPWGSAPPDGSRANLAYDGRLAGGPAPIGSLTAGSSPWGAQQMVGDVWEWTSSDFAGYPRFESFPYREYSEVFFGTEYKVLRGGSWASHPLVMRTTFRNWDYPMRRQIFAGFRCARDA